MSRPIADAILANLARVDALRTQQRAQPAHAAAVLALKTYQSRRFAHAYRDLLAEPRHQAAAQFFLQRLYGPMPFEERDRQFARVVPAIGRIFPRAVLDTVERLAEVHALSETFDDQMAGALATRGAAEAINAAAYGAAWCAVGRPDDRQRQIALILELAQRLDRLTAKRALRLALHLMREPARLAGLGSLQEFLESGFDAFAAMRGATDFIARVRERETALMQALFAGHGAALADLP